MDQILRRALEPDPTTAERLIQEALTSPEPSRPHHRFWPLAAAALVLLVILGRPDSSRAPLTDGTPVAPSPIPVSSEPMPLRISNEAGSVIVTTPAGSKMIFLQPSQSTGDAS